MMPSFGRRRFLRAMARCASGAALSRLASPQSAAPFFEDMPPSASGIHWTHTGGLSSDMYLPETIGPRLRLPRLRQRRLDGHLPGQQRPLRFLHSPHPLRNALYRNNRDGTFTDVTAKAGVPGGGYGMGIAVATTTPTASPIST